MNRRDQTRNQPSGATEERISRTREVLQTSTKQIQRYVVLGSKRIPYRSLIVTFEIIGGIVFVAFLAVIIAHMRLSQGPVSLKFLVEPIETAINKEMSGSVIRIGDAVVQYDENKSIRFRLQSVSLFDNKGDIVAQAPRAAIRLSGAALLKGRIAPAIVEFIEPRILLFYSNQNGLSLSFPENANLTPSGAQSQTPDAGSGPGIISEGARTNQISLSQSIGKALDMARHRRTASSYLTRFGLRDALVAFEHDGRQSYWRVPYFELNMDHQKKRSVISGAGRIASSDADWGLKFRIKEFARKDRIEIESEITHLIPSKLQKNLPLITSIEGTTTPINAKLKMKMSRSWDVREAKLTVDLGQGLLSLPGLRRPPNIKTAKLNFLYSKKKNQIALINSFIRWDDSEAMLHGLAKFSDKSGGARIWGISLTAQDVKLDMSSAPLMLDDWKFSGRYIPDARYLGIDDFQISTEGATIAIQGHVAKGTTIPDIEITGRIDPMPFMKLKKLWPAYLMPDAYDWFQDSIFGGDVTRGLLNISTHAAIMAANNAAARSAQPAALTKTGDWTRRAIRLEIDGKNVEVEYLKQMPHLKTGAVKLLVSGQSVITRIPEGSITLPSGRQVNLRDGEIRILDFFPDVPQGEIIFEADAGALAVLELLDHKPLGYVSRVGFASDAISGKVKGNIHLSMPFYKDVAFAEVKIDARLNLEDGVLKQRFGKILVNGGSISFGVTEKALEASGDILIGGVPAKLHWQRIFSAKPDKQPPIRINANLDNADRDQLGLEVNHVVQGEMPVVLTIAVNEKGQRRVSAQADLTNSELILENMSWRKLPGHTAILEFDIAPREGGRTELQNFKIVGDNIAIDGWLSLNENNRLDAFYFPEFSINLITHLQIEGKLNNKKIWQVKARGTTYDGRNLFRSLFSAGAITTRKLERPKDRQGIDLDAKIANVMGFEETMLKGVNVKMSRRRGKLTALDAHGHFDDGAPINVRMVHETGKPRFLVSETKNAGNAFRLVGFYPSVIGGSGSLRVNMDGKGYAEKIGKLWASNFYIRGDPVVGKVLVNTPDENVSPSIPGKRKSGRKVRYSKTQFDHLKMSFSVGQGQLVLHDAYINGPLIGATIRGRVDYERKRVDLGGTYVPLYGLNSVVGEIPLIGPLFRGRRGEGLFGITFLVQGRMDKPNVIVNPISVITPGIFRQIFDMVPSNTRVRPRPKPSPPRDVVSRASSAPAVTTIPVKRAGPHPPPPPIPAPARRPKVSQPESWATETFAN